MSCTFWNMRRRQAAKEKAERIAAEKALEQARLEAEKQAELERQEAEKKAEAARRAAERRAARKAEADNDNA